MAEDKREAILARLFEIYEKLAEDNNGSAYRNRTNIPEAKLPAIVLLDADESADENPFGGKGRGPGGPVILNMKPETWIFVMDDPKSVGPSVSDFRAKLLKAVLGDQTLIALCNGGDIRYDGFETALAGGRSMAGEARVSFTLRYVLRPGAL